MLIPLGHWRDDVLKDRSGNHAKGRCQARRKASRKVTEPSRESAPPLSLEEVLGVVMLHLTQLPIGRWGLPGPSKTLLKFSIEILQHLQSSSEAISEHLFLKPLSVFLQEGGCRRAFPRSHGSGPELSRSTSGRFNEHITLAHKVEPSQPVF